MWPSIKSPTKEQKRYSEQKTNNNKNSELTEDRKIRRIFFYHTFCFAQLFCHIFCSYLHQYYKYVAYPTGMSIWYASPMEWIIFDSCFVRSSVRCRAVCWLSCYRNLASLCNSNLFVSTELTCVFSRIRIVCVTSVPTYVKNVDGKHGLSLRCIWQARRARARTHTRHSIKLAYVV